LGKPQDVEMAVLRMTYEGSSGILVPHGVRLVASMPKRNTPLMYLTRPIAEYGERGYERQRDVGGVWDDIGRVG
jgi:hypothetical protein